MLMTTPVVRLVVHHDGENRAVVYRFVYDRYGDLTKITADEFHRLVQEEKAWVELSMFSTESHHKSLETQPTPFMEM